MAGGDAAVAYGHRSRHDPAQGIADNSDSANSAPGECCRRILYGTGCGRWWWRSPRWRRRLLRRLEVISKSKVRKSKVTNASVCFGVPLTLDFGHWTLTWNWSHDRS